MKDALRLVADIGGTNARFAMATPDKVGFVEARTLQCADFPTAVDAIEHYLTLIDASTPEAVCLAAAGPVVGGKVIMTNCAWTLSESTIGGSLGVDRVRLINDFEALAWSIPHLSAEDLEAVGIPSHLALSAGDFSIAVIGPGTGFGAAGLIARGNHLTPMVSEAGHSGFAPGSSRQIDVLNVLRESHERVCIEHLLSGSGVEAIYSALRTLEGEQGEPLSATGVFAAAAAGSDPFAVDAIQLFFEVLGQVAGDVALVLGASHGVFIAGGVVKRYPDMLHASRFREAFEAKGVHRAVMKRIPTMLITYDEPGLLGAASQV